jgi:hypothetical protein
LYAKYKDNGHPPKIKKIKNKILGGTEKLSDRKKRKIAGRVLIRLIVRQIDCYIGFGLANKSVS